MIHAENGDMIEWLTGKFIAEGSRMLKIDSDTEKLETKGMVGKYTHTYCNFISCLLTYTSSLLSRLVASSAC